MSQVVLTIGHSNRTLDALVALLRENAVDVVADVRSQPFSRLYPQFNRDSLDAGLQVAGIKYLFLGKELGARSTDSRCYTDGRVRYERLAETAPFKQAIERVVAGAKRGFRIALLCAEKEPLHCHRSILIARHLHARGLQVEHILGPGEREPHDSTIERLLQDLSMGSLHLFKTTKELQQMAYEIQGEKIAFIKEDEDETRS